MREAAFAEFHQVCHVVSQALWFCCLSLFRILRGHLFEKCKGAGTCGFNNLKLHVRQEANDYLSVETYNSV